MLKLEVFWLTDEQAEAIQDGVPVSFKDCDTETRTFMMIESYAPFTDEEGNKYTSIYSGGNEWVCAHDIATFEGLLLSQLRK